MQRKYKSNWQKFKYKIRTWYYKRFPHYSVIRYRFKNKVYEKAVYLWFNCFSKLTSLKTIEIYSHKFFIKPKIQKEMQDKIDELIVLGRLMNYNIKVSCIWGGSEKWYGQWLCIDFVKGNRRYILQFMLDNVRRILRKTNLRVFETSNSNCDYDVYSEDTNIFEPLIHLRDKL